MGVIKTGGAGGQAPEGIECPKYRALPGSKRCQHYAEGGGCALATEFMCIEWSKLNDPDLYERQRAELARALYGSETPEPGGATLAAGGPLAAPSGPGSLAPAEQPSGAQAGAQAAPRPHLGTAVATAPEELAATPRPFDPAVLTDQALAELEAAGVEVCVASTDLEDVWLVPAFTDQDRPELTYRMARTLLVTMTILPGATLRAIRRGNPNHEDPLR